MEPTMRSPPPYDRNAAVATLSLSLGISDIFKFSRDRFLLYYIIIPYTHIFYETLHARYSQSIIRAFHRAIIITYILCFSSHVVLLFDETIIWLKPIHDENDEDDEDDQ